MHRHRRLVPFALIVAILATAMAPLLGALREASGGEPIPLCHQAGMQVDAASAPLSADPGEVPTRKTHCPLCVMVFFGAFGAAPLVPSFYAVAVLPATMAPVPFVPRARPASPFQSRAPPVVA